MNVISAALMLTCKEMTVLIEQSNHEGIGLIGRVRMAAHTAMCVPCATYKQQSKRIDAMLRKAMNLDYAFVNSETVQRLKTDIKKQIGLQR